MIANKLLTDNLYLVQDAERPLYVISDSWTNALEEWKRFIATDNGIDVSEVDEPRGITLLGEDTLGHAIPRCFEVI